MGVRGIETGGQLGGGRVVLVLVELEVVFEEGGEVGLSVDLAQEPAERDQLVVLLAIVEGDDRDAVG